MIIAIFRSKALLFSENVFLSESHAGYLIVSWVVPQGSVLGSPFFLIYINDLPQLSSKVSVSFYLFEDDANIYYEVKNLILFKKGC